MGRAVIAIAGTVAGLVLLLSFKTTGTAARSTSAASPAPAIVRRRPATTTTATTTNNPSTATTTVTGDVSENQYGPVQVQVTVRNGKVTAVDATQYPDGDSRSAQINAYAIPALNEEALQAGSANINLISGASYTSNSYLDSLQSALSKAGLA